MSDAYELFSETHDALPDDLIRFLVDEACPEAELTKRGKTSTYRWPRLTIRVKAMSARVVEQSDATAEIRSVD